MYVAKVFLLNCCSAGVRRDIYINYSFRYVYFVLILMLVSYVPNLEYEPQTAKYI